MPFLHAFQLVKCKRSGRSIDISKVPMRSYNHTITLSSSSLDDAYPLDPPLQPNNKKAQRTEDSEEILKIKVK